MVVIFPKRLMSESLWFWIAHLQPMDEICGVSEVTL